jgi:mevalonate kinase
MSRQKNAVPSERVRLDGYVGMPITDPRVQKFWDWYVENRSARKAFPMAMELLMAALNGELGSGVQWAVESGNEEELRQQLEAAQDIAAAFVVE